MIATSLRSLLTFEICEPVRGSQEIISHMRRVAYDLEQLENIGVNPNMALRAIELLQEFEKANEFSDEELIEELPFKNFEQFNKFCEILEIYHNFTRELWEA